MPYRQSLCSLILSPAMLVTGDAFIALSEVWLKSGNVMPASESQPRVQVMTPQAAQHGQERRRVLVVDDDRRMASSLAQWLCSQGWHATAVGTPEEAIAAIGRHRCDCCFVDAGLPDSGSERVAGVLRTTWPDARLIAVASAFTAATAQRLGADDILLEPVADAAVLAALAADPTKTASPSQPIRHDGRRRFLGRSPAMRAVLGVVDKIAATPATVLLTGESGTGKSLLAREIHRRSERAQRRLVEIACGSLSESLLESELFGHVAGAFTGATTSREGMFARADGSTIFLDEIATATPAMQVKLLRVLQDFEFEPVGGSEPRQVDARVILATHEDLEGLVAEGRFRGDLFWRINVISIELPPLRERREDILPLAESFLPDLSSKTSRTLAGFTDRARECLEAHHWPGNIRELRHAVERAAYLGTGAEIDLSDLPTAVVSGARRSRSALASTTLREQLANPERQLILDALRRHDGRRDAAARALGINRATLYKKAKRLGVDLASMGRNQTAPA